MPSKLLFALLGQNVSYSRSPDIFNAIFDTLNIEGSFLSVDSTEELLQSKVTELTDLGVTGFSVTIPFKQSINRFLDRIDDSASKIGAVNSVCNSNGELIGYNTDVVGFLYPLRGLVSDLHKDSILIIGAGGSARAVIDGLYSGLGARCFCIANRDIGKLEDFRSSLKRTYGSIEIELFQFDKLPDSLSKSCKLIVNCTPLGGPNYPSVLPLSEKSSVERGSIFYDLNYNTGNKALESARQKGMKVIDGSAMLVAQAIESFEIWTGKTVPFDPIYKAVFGERQILDKTDAT